MPNTGGVVNEHTGVSRTVRILAGFASIMVAAGLLSQGFGGGVYPPGGVAGGGTGNVKGGAGLTTAGRVVIVDSAGTIAETADCTVSSGVLSCKGFTSTDGTVTSGVVLPELVANGSSKIGLYSPDALAASYCHFLPSVDSDLGDTLVDSGTTAMNTQGDTCTIWIYTNPAARYRCADAGSTDAYACDTPVNISAYTTGEHYYLKAATANTGASTADFSSVGAQAIKKTNNNLTTDTATGDICAGMWLDLVWNGTNFQMMTPTCTPPSGSGGLEVDGFYTKSGSTYYIGVTNKVATLPTVPSWSWQNQGSAAVATVGNAIAFTIPTSATTDIHMRYVAVPTAPYTCTMGIMPGNPAGSYSVVGMGLSDGTKIVTFGQGYNGATTGGYSITAQKYTTVTAYSATYFDTPLRPVSGILWLVIQDNSTNRILSHSLDGGTYTTDSTVANTDFLTVTRIGFLANNEVTSGGFTSTVVSWSCI